MEIIFKVVLIGMITCIATMIVKPIRSYFSIIIGFIFGYMGMLEIGIIVQFVTLLFELVTLPVEFNASSRALKQLEGFNMFAQEEVSGSKKMLTAAALTYVAALVTTLINLLRLVLLARRRD